MIPTPRCVAVFAVAVASTQPPAQASETDENLSMETVYVVGQLTNTVIEPEQLEQFQANDLADIFRHIPSVSVGGSLGIAQKIYLRGLEDTYVNVTLDGAPQTGTLFHHIGRVAIEPELLKTVEIQTGAGEATSGAGVIGGAIRFKSKNPSDLLKNNQATGAMLKTGYFSNEGWKASLTGYTRLSENWGLLGSYTKVDRENMEDGEGIELFGSAAQQTLTYIKASGLMTDTQSLSLSYERREEHGDFGQRPNWPALEADTLYPIDGERDTLVANYEWSNGHLLNLTATLYQTESSIVQDVFDRWGEYEGKINSTGFDMRNTSILGGHKITYGIDYRQDTSESRYLDSGALALWAWDPDVGNFKEEGTIAGLYIQDHWQITHSVELSYGLRYDDYELDQVTYNSESNSDGVSPNIGVEWQLLANWLLNLGYAEALRGKEVGDSFTLEHEPGVASIQDDLQAEKVENLEAGLEYNDGKLFGSFAIYQTDISDVIHDQLGRGIFYENNGELKTDGVELTLGYQWDSLLLSASFATQDAELNGNTVEGYEHIGLGNARGDTFTMELHYNLSENLQLGWQFTHTDDLNNIEVLQRAVELGWIDQTQTVDKTAYSLHDVFVRWTTMQENLTFDLAVINLLDEHYRDHSSVADYGHIPGWEGIAGLYEAGRDIRLSATVKF